MGKLSLVFHYRLTTHEICFATVHVGLKTLIMLPMFQHCPKSHTNTHRVKFSFISRPLHFQLDLATAGQTRSGPFGNRWRRLINLCVKGLAMKTSQALGTVGVKQVASRIASGEVHHAGG